MVFLVEPRVCGSGLLLFLIIYIMRQVSTSPNRHFRARGFEFLVWGLSVWLRLLGLGLWFGNQRTSKALLVRGWDSIKI